jgi:uncharacterized protein YfdQ (DUF2303 family)
MGGFTMIVKLKGDADDFIALSGEYTGNDGGVDAPGHGDNYARVLGTLGDIKRIQHVFPIRMGSRANG